MLLSKVTLINNIDSKVNCKKIDTFTVDKSSSYHMIINSPQKRNFIQRWKNMFKNHSISVYCCRERIDIYLQRLLTKHVCNQITYTIRGKNCVIGVTHVMNKFYNNYYDITIEIMKTEEQHKDIVYKQSNVKDSCVDFGRLSLDSRCNTMEKEYSVKRTYSDNYIPINEHQANYLQFRSMKKTSSMGMNKSRNPEF